MHPLEVERRLVFVGLADRAERVMRLEIDRLKK